jgi:hypothetical protein
MDFYTGKRPNLIGPIMKSTMCRISQKPIINNTVSDKITEYISGIYNEYIIEHKFIVISIIIFILFLIYRYYETKNKKQESFANQDYNLLKDIKEYQTRHLKYDTQPVMNPTQSVESQKEEVYYPPDPLPVNIPDTGFVYSRNLYPDPPAYPSINNSNYNHNNVYENSSRSYYNGTYNTYQNAKDTDIINPYGWSNNFNTNTGSFVGNMTEENRQVMSDYQAIMDNNNSNLTDALKYGNKYIEANTQGYNLEPPYAPDF